MIIHWRLLVSGMLLFSAYSFAQPEESLANANIAVRVADKTITQRQLSQVQQLMSQQAGQMLSQEIVQGEMIKTLLLAQEAEKRQLHTREETRQALAYTRDGLLASILLSHLRSELQPTDKEIQEASQALPTEEYRLGYMLVADKTLAEQVVRELNNKKDFSALAKTYSLDSSREAGGDIEWSNDWLTSPALIPVIASLSVGQHTQTSIKGQQSWQVLQLKAKRPITQEMKDALLGRVAAQLVDEKIHRYIGQLREQADITYP